MARNIVLLVILGVFCVGVNAAHIISARENRFPVSIIHVNDFHAR